MDGFLSFIHKFGQWLGGRKADQEFKPAAGANSTFPNGKSPKATPSEDYGPSRVGGVPATEAKDERRWTTQDPIDQSQNGDPEQFAHKFSHKKSS
ncbi:MAG: hypothetical protein VXY77_03395 [Pseudomonadota bacterium]|nr:hypothetical protein [Pseudomonadota bacterium]